MANTQEFPGAPDFTAVAVAVQTVLGGSAAYGKLEVMEAATRLPCFLVFEIFLERFLIKLQNKFEKFIAESKAKIIEMYKVFEMEQDTEIGRRNKVYPSLRHHSQSEFDVQMKQQ